MEENIISAQETKFCKECGQKISKKAVICPLCGCQVEETKSEAAPQIVINNSNQNQNTNNISGGFPVGARLRNKWISLALCGFLGYLGAHKFYEGKGGAGILYLCTFGLFGIGAIIDFINLLGKPNPYCVF